MRIIAGTYRGRRLNAPKGEGTRPTTDRVREAMMSAVFSARGSFDGAVVLDAFAGSGALGLEAVSRGADAAVFCERDRAALSVLRRNVALFEGENLRVVAGDVTHRIPSCSRGAYDLVFFDPPYAEAAQARDGVFASPAAAGLIADGALIVFEHDASFDPRDAAAASALEWSEITRKQYGDTIVDILKWRERA